MSIPPRTPVIVGRAQVVAPPPDVAAPIDAFDLMIEAARVAIGDAGVPADAVDTIGVVAGLFREPDPARVISRAIGADARTILTTMGGNTPVAFVGELGSRLLAGEVDAVLVVGGEANLSRSVRRRAGAAPHRRPATTDAPDEVWGAPLVMADEVDVARGGEFPRNTYAVFETALRHAARETIDEARDRAARLWAGYAAAAAANPDLPPHVPLDADAIRNPTPANRMVTWPYTKAMCANNTVDQAGALLLTTEEVADRHDVPREQRVYLHHTVVSADTDSFLDRAHLTVVPGIDAAAARLRERWGPLAELDHVDLYGCFPSIVRYTAAALGLPEDRALTVTGGLGFMGAPLNFAAGQSLVAMVRRLRDDPGTFGLVQGNGGHAAKHAFGVYSTEAPSTPAVHEVLEPALSGRTRGAADAVGPGVIEGFTVEFGRDGPERVVAVCDLDEGRVWATSTDPATIATALDAELVGAAVRVDGGIFEL